MNELQNVALIMISAMQPLRRCSRRSLLQCIRPSVTARLSAACRPRMIEAYHGLGLWANNKGTETPRSNQLSQSTSTISLRPYSTRTENETKSGSKDKSKVLLPKRILASLPAHENIYTIPNILTFSRLVAAPVIGYLILHEQHVAALSLFIYAGATDLIDGWVARKWNLQTVVGTVIDPMADKTLMTVLTVSLAMQGAMPLPLAILILGRDFLLSLAAVYYRYISLPPPKTLARYWDFSLPSAEVHPTGISKVNTALQLGLIGWTMGTMAVGGDLGWWGPEGALKAMWYLVGTTTVWSGASYIYTKDAVKILTSRKAR